MKIGKKKTLKEQWNDVKDKFESGFYKVFPWIQIWTTLIIILILGFIAMLLFTPVEIQTEGWCNSGNINLDIEAENIIQNTTCWDTHFNSTGVYKTPDKSRENITCFDQTFMLQHIKLKNIDGLNCQGSAKIKMPLILSLFMGDRNDW